MSYQPIIIIGAARSGTNMLRDMMTQFAGYGTWPCDEINLIWRHGNKDYPSDELTAKHATPNVSRYIRGAFDKLATQGALTHVVEKTCANSLRVSFVDAIFPDAKYVFLVRDGRDAAASAMKRWVKPNSMAYTLAKLKFAPPVDIPYYALGFLSNQIYRLRSSEKRLGTWGPIFQGLREYASTHTLAEVCAMQWVKSVELADRDFASIAPDRVHRMRYEDVAIDPVKSMTALSAFLNVEMDMNQAQTLTKGVSTKSVGAWKRDLTDVDAAKVQPILADMLAKFDYS